MASSSPLYTKFTNAQRRWIIILIASAAWFSTLSSFIYYPVIPLASELETPIERINLTITAYLVISGIAPSITGHASDMFGRRPLYLITLTLYLAANLGMALQTSFMALLLLRMMQSAGISGTFSIAYGVVADITTPAERGTFVGALTLGITTAPTIGPLLGASLAYGVGWRWIFGFLAITSGIVLVSMALMLPETARSVVENGSIPPPWYSHPCIPSVMRPWQNASLENTTLIPRKKSIPNPLSSFLILNRPDATVSITAGGIIYMIYCSSHASLSTILAPAYGLSQLQTGLIYLPFGIGSLIATVVSGRLIDYDYKAVAKSHNLHVDRLSGDNLRQFPIEKARLRSIQIPTLLTCGSMIGYGWAVYKRANISVSLILQFISGFCIQTCFNYNNTLVIDINHEAPATAQAAFNMVRCALAAISIAALQPMINWAGFGATFSALGYTCIISSMLYLLEMHYGMKWRLKRYEERNSETSPLLGPDS